VTDRTLYLIDFSGDIVEDSIATLALISSSLGPAVLAQPFDKSIRQEHITSPAMPLNRTLLSYQPLFMNLFEYILNNLSMNRFAGPSKMIKSYLEPLINLLMNLMVLIAYILGCFLLLQSFNLAGCSVLISSTYIQSIVSH